MLFLIGGCRISKLYSASSLCFMIVFIRHFIFQIFYSTFYVLIGLKAGFEFQLETTGTYCFKVLLAKQFSTMRVLFLFSFVVYKQLVFRSEIFLIAYFTR